MREAPTEKEAESRVAAAINAGHRPPHRISSTAARRLRIALIILAPTLILASVKQLSSWWTTNHRGATTYYEVSISDDSPVSARATLPIERTISAENAFPGVVRMAFSGSWLFLLERGKASVIDTTDGALHDLPSLGASFGIAYSDVVAGPTDSFILSSIKDAPLLIISLTKGDDGNVIAQVKELGRGPDWDRSLMLRKGRWVSARSWEGGGLRFGAVQNRAIVHEPMSGLGPYPDVSSPVISSMLNRSTIAMAPNGRHVAQAFMMSCRLHIYSDEGALERQVAAPVDIKLEYWVYLDAADEQEKMAPHKRMKYCYTDLAATIDGIFGLFSGRLQGTATHFQDDLLHEITWDGRTAGVWRLASGVKALAMAPDGQRLWGVLGERGTLVEFLAPSHPDVRVGTK